MGRPAALLFVYGTLKRGGVNFALIRDQRFVGEAVTAPRYRVYDLGPYPGLVRDDAYGLAVAGELWEVSACALGELDDFETDADEFARGPVEVAGVDGPVEAYFYVGPIPAAVPSGDRWPLG